MGIETRQIMFAEMKPDIYGGENCDEHIPQWEAYAEGDMGSDTFDSPLILDPKSFPPGTLITIRMPVCPKCEEVYDNCIVRSDNMDSCDFDWTVWTEEQYS